MNRKSIIGACPPLFLLLCLAASTASAETVRDEFPSTSYNGNNGTQNWSAAWQEQGESDGASSGLVRVVSSSRCASGNCMRIGGNSVDITGFGLVREADLLGAVSATLTFSYRRQVSNPGASLTLSVSDDGGSSWTPLQTYDLDAGDSGQVPQSFDITAFIASDTQIRFLGSGTTGSGNNRFYADNVQIEFLGVDVSGTVYEDVNGDAGLAGDSGRDGVTVRLYADDGDGTPDAGDTLEDTTSTSGGGYTFTDVFIGRYWVSFDSKTISPGAGFGSGGQSDVWAEQTYGAAGALCTDGAGSTVQRVTAGPCYAGRRGGVSDDATALQDAEHVIRVNVVSVDITGVDAALSFNVATDVRDGDDDGGAARTIQGGVRQFVQNAEAISGSNALRFVPAVATNGSGTSGTWWEVALTSALPRLDDSDTTLDGRAHDLADGTTVLDPNSAVAETTTGPELVLDSSADGPGIQIRGADTVIDGVGIHSTPNSGADGAGVLIDDTSAAGSIVRDSTIWNNGNAGVRLEDTTDIQVLNNVSRDNGTLEPNADGVELDGCDNITISGNELLGNAAYGVDLRSSANDDNTISNNLVKANGVSASVQDAGIGLRSGSNNTISGNTVTANPGDGLIMSSSGSGNRITQNSFSANGALAIDLGGGDTGDGVTLNDSGDSDTGPNTLYNYPILDTAQVSRGNLILAGWARPGAVIELFLSDSDPSGFGEGSTYLTTLTEGSASDTDATSSSYGPGPINGLSQGTDTTNRFRFQIPAPGGVGVGSVLAATGTDASDNTSEFSGNVTVGLLPLIVKRAFQPGGAPIPDTSTVPQGMPVKFLLYVNNPGGVLTDLSLQDVLDPGFLYVAGSIKFDDSLAACAAVTCTAAEEAAIFAAADSGTAGSDAVDGDVVSFAGTTLDAGDQTVANARLDVAANTVWSVVLSVTVQ